MKQFIILTFCCLLLGSVTVAQRSMMEEVSGPYLEKLIALAKANYPRLKIHTKQVSIAEKNANKLKLSWFDGLGIYYLYLPPTAAAGTINPVTSGGGFQLGFSFNVGSLLQKPAQINSAKLQVDVSKLEKQEYELNIAANVKERYYKYIQQLILLKQRSQLSQDAETMLTSARSKFERGQETFEVYSKALVFLNEQVQGKINTETELLIAKAQLEELLNVKLEEIK